MSLRARVLAGIVAVALVLTGAAVVIARVIEAELVDEVDAQLATATVPARGFDVDGRGPRGGISGPQRLSAMYIGTVGPTGAVVTLFEPNLSGDATPLPRLDPDEVVAAAGSGETFTAGALDSDLRYRVRAVTLPRTGRVVVLALPLDSVDAAVDRLVRIEALATIAVLLVLALVAWWVVHLGVRPLKEMTEVAAAIGDGDLARRVPEADPRTEAGALGAALNRMLGRIESAFAERRGSEERLRRFVGDASHELRNPVATIRGYAELYRTGALSDRAALDDAMRRTEQEAVRMGALVDDLLVLARLDQQRPLGSGPVDVAALARDAAADARALDPDRPVTVDADGPLVVLGDDARLRQVLANLVANALVHTAPGTPVAVAASRDGTDAVLTVTDSGPGMAPEVAERAFERFFRGDPARSRHRGGSGLGLAIVDAVVAAHGGTASLESSPEAGTRVTVRLPLAT